MSLSDMAKKSGEFVKKKGLIISLGGFLAFIAALPTLCSTTPGKNITVVLAKKLAKASLDVEDLSLSWFGSQTIQGLAYKSQKLQATCQKLTLEEGLLSLFFHPKTFSSLELTEPSVYLSSSKDSLTVPSVNQASFIPSVGEVYLTSYQELLPFTGHIHITKGSLQVDDVVFSPIEIDVTLQGDKAPSSISIAIEATQSGVKGSLKAEALLSKEPSINAKAVHFPLIGIDKLLPASGMLLNLIGPTLDLECLVSTKDALWQADITLQSKQITTSLQLQVKEGILQLLSPSSLQITLTQDGAKYLDETLTLSAPLVCSLQVSALFIPMQDNAPLFPKAAFSSTFSIAPYAITPKMQVNLQGAIETKELGVDLECRAKAEVITKGVPALAQVSATLSRVLSEKPSLQASLQTEKIPTKVIESFVDSSLLNYLGNWIQASCQIVGTKQKADLTLTASTPLLNTQKIEACWQDAILTLTSPLSISYELNHPLLQNSANVAVNISKGSWGKDRNLLDANIDISPMFFTQLLDKKGYQIPRSKIDIQMSSLEDIHVAIQNPFLSLNSVFALNSTILSIKTPMTLEYKISEQSLPISLPSALTFDEATLRLTCNSAKILLQNTKKTEPISVRLEMTPLLIQNRKTTLSLPIEYLQLDTTVSLEKETVSISYEMELAKAPITGSAALNSFSFLEYTADISAKKLPIKLLEGLVQSFSITRMDFSSLIGEELSINAQISNVAQNKKLSLGLQSSLLTLKGAFGLQSNTLSSLSPTSLQYTLTPKGYKSYLSSPFSLQKDVQIAGSIEQLIIPLDFNLDKAQGIAKVSSSTIVLESKEMIEPLTLSNSKLVLSKKAQGKDLTLTADLQAKEGYLQLTGLLSALKPIEGSLQVKATQFPSEALDFLSMNKHSFYPILLGPSFAGSCYLSLVQGTGPLSIALQSPKAHFDMQAEISSSALTLRKDLTADLLLTPELGKLFIKTDSPIRSLSASRPITFWASKQGFSIPIKNNLSAIEIPNIQINLGKVYCKNEGAMASALEQLKSKEPSGKEIEIWFTPLDLHVRQGNIEIERTEFLLDKKFDLALWGEVNLPTNYAKLTLGITADAIREAFGMKQLPKDYVLKIPVEGPLDNIQIKSKTAATKIAALLLWQSDLLSKAAGPFGGVLKQVIPPPGGEGKTPPAKHPFPWESETPLPSKKKKNKSR